MMVLWARINMKIQKRILKKKKHTLLKIRETNREKEKQRRGRLHLDLIARHFKALFPNEGMVNHAFRKFLVQECGAQNLSSNPKIFKPILSDRAIEKAIQLAVKRHWIAEIPSWSERHQRQ